MVYGLGVVYATDNMPRRDVAVNHHMYLLQCCSHVNDVRFLSSLGSFLGSLGCVTSCWTRWRVEGAGMIRDHEDGTEPEERSGQSTIHGVLFVSLHRCAACFYVRPLHRRPWRTMGTRVTSWGFSPC
jgi:hypothetical protein